MGMECRPGISLYRPGVGRSGNAAHTSVCATSLSATKTVAFAGDFPFLLGANHQNSHMRAGRRDVLIRSGLRVLSRIEFHTQEAQVGTRPFSKPRGVLA